uniref:Glycogen debranching enzyme n=1 Tax=Caenorhabditis tropicalis TaxID=1561998 RepID=A0A1I7TP62_9PELO
MADRPEPSIEQSVITLNHNNQQHRFYRPGHGVFGHLPDPPKRVFESQGGLTPESAQRVHLINAFRRYGYLEAQLDPLGLRNVENTQHLFLEAQVVHVVLPL